MAEKIYSLDGLKCDSCVKRIEKEIGKIDGVKRISVNLINKTAKVDFDGSIIDENKIKNRILELGYCVDGNCPAKERGILKGIMYGLLPHTGCIAFIGLTVLGITAGAAFFRPLLNTYFFYGLIIFSLILTTISAILYLKKQGLFSLDGIKQKSGYLAILFGTTIFVNILLLSVVFPYATNVAFNNSSTAGQTVLSQNSVNINNNENVPNNIGVISLDVDIPCGGHASLIISELRKDSGVKNVKYSFPYIFDVTYDISITSKEEILTSPIFREYPARLIKG